MQVAFNTFLYVMGAILMGGSMKVVIEGLKYAENIFDWAIVGCCALLFVTGVALIVSLTKTVIKRKV